jgi:hypothetical protein
MFYFRSSVFQNRKQAAAWHLGRASWARSCGGYEREMLGDHKMGSEQEPLDFIHKKEWLRRAEGKRERAVHDRRIFRGQVYG